MHHAFGQDFGIEAIAQVAAFEFGAIVLVDAGLFGFVYRCHERHVALKLV
jgi:hypothetical protein